MALTMTWMVTIGAIAGLAGGWAVMTGLVRPRRARRPDRREAGAAAVELAGLLALGAFLAGLDLKLVGAF